MISPRGQASPSRVGFGSTLGVQERLIHVIPRDRQGQVLGLATSGMMTMQAVAATLTGACAEVTGAGTAMAVAAVASLAVTGLLMRYVSPRWRAPAGAELSPTRQGSR